MVGLFTPVVGSGSGVGGVVSQPIVQAPSNIGESVGIQALASGVKTIASLFSDNARSGGGDPTKLSEGANAQMNVEVSDFIRTEKAMREQGMSEASIRVKQDEFFKGKPAQYGAAYYEATGRDVGALKAETSRRAQATFENEQNEFKARLEIVRKLGINTTRPDGSIDTEKVNQAYINNRNELNAALSHLSSTARLVSGGDLGAGIAAQQSMESHQVSMSESARRAAEWKRNEATRIVSGSVIANFTSDLSELSNAYTRGDIALAQKIEKGIQQKQGVLASSSEGRTLAVNNPDEFKKIMTTINDMTDRARTMPGKLNETMTQALVMSLRSNGAPDADSAKMVNNYLTVASIFGPNTPVVVSKDDQAKLGTVLSQSNVAQVLLTHTDVDEEGNMEASESLLQDMRAAATLAGLPLRSVPSQVSGPVTESKVFVAGNPSNIGHAAEASRVNPEKVKEIYANDPETAKRIETSILNNLVRISKAEDGVTVIFENGSIVFKGEKASSYDKTLEDFNDAFAPLPDMNKRIIEANINRLYEKDLTPESLAPLK